MLEQLNKNHNKQGFDCGNEMLNRYLHHQASQDIKRKLAACFVHTSSREILGYYTLSNTSIPLDLLPPSIRKKLPTTYKAIPATLLGRLAVSNKQQGQGIGKLLLMDALHRSYITSTQLASFAVVVDPIDSHAKAFYEYYGFIQLPDSGKMFIAMKTLGVLFTK
jgi:predicted GNAT family N-acyltransferase